MGGSLPDDSNSVLLLSHLLDPIPELGLHLNIRHANLQVQRNTTDELLRAYGMPLRHVHLHDNKGGNADLHLPLGSGNLDFHRQIQLLRAIGYDRMITLEVFSKDKHYLACSRDVLWKLSEEVAPPKPALYPAAQPACCD